MASDGGSVWVSNKTTGSERDNMGLSEKSVDSSHYPCVVKSKVKHVCLARLMVQWKGQYGFLLSIWRQNENQRGIRVRMWLHKRINMTSY